MSNASGQRATPHPQRDQQRPTKRLFLEQSDLRARQTEQRTVCSHVRRSSFLGLPRGRMNCHSCTKRTTRPRTHAKRGAAGVLGGKRRCRCCNGHAGYNGTDRESRTTRPTRCVYAGLNLWRRQPEEAGRHPDGRRERSRKTPRTSVPARETKSRQRGCRPLREEWGVTASSAVAPQRMLASDHTCGREVRSVLGARSPRKVVHMFRGRVLHTGTRGWPSCEQAVCAVVGRV